MAYLVSLRVLDKHEVPASFFIPAVSSILHPQMIQSILAGERHEIGVHGWIHENPALLESEEEERRLLDQTIEYFHRDDWQEAGGFTAPPARTLASIPSSY